MQRKRIACLITLALAAMSASAAKAEEAKVELSTIEVVAGEEEEIDEVSSESTKAYRVEQSRSATRLNLSIKDTPQSINVITNQVLKDFNLISIQDALNIMPGVNVERVETDRTYFTARGFDVTNFQVDHLNTTAGAVFGNLQGDIDTVIYDRVEVLRGANGLLTGIGNPSATINFVRKRPTDELQASAIGQIGSWNNKRAVGDISGALNESGTVRARLVASYQDADSYLDRYEKKKTVAYGVVDFQLSDAFLLTLGHSYQKDEPDSPMWGALEVVYSDGTPTNFSTGDSNAAEWAFWDNTTENSFIELQGEFANGWQAKAQYVHLEQEGESNLFYTYGALDKDTGSGMYSYPSHYSADIESDTVDVYASGPFNLMGREHELVVGAQWQQTDLSDYSWHGNNAFQEITYAQYLNGTYPQPTAFNIDGGGGSTDEEIQSAYAAVKLNPIDNVKVILGARLTDYELKGDRYGTISNINKDEFIPYYGLVVSITDWLNAYGSYTEVFQPQNENDINYKTLDPIEGKSWEFGVKMDIHGGKAIASAAVFRNIQDNLATPAGTIPGTVLAYHTAEDGITSQGVDLDIQGEILPGVNVLAGYTYVDIDDADGNHTRTFSPKQTFKFSTTYRVTDKWVVGGTVNWRDKTTGTLIEQDAYAVWDAMVKYQATPNLSASLNVNNIFDKEYYTSLYWSGVFGQGFKAAPRSAMLSVNYTY